MMSPYSPEGQQVNGFLLDQTGHLPMRHASWQTSKITIILD